MNWIIARLKEPSTWRGIVMLVAAFGVHLDPEAWERIIVIASSAFALIEILRREKAVEVRKALPVTAEDRNRDVGRTGNPAK